MNYMVSGSKNSIREKSYAFAVRVVHASRFIASKKQEFVLSKQLLRSGTSIGANVREASQAQSRKDFISKMSIALKEAHETEYWIELMTDTSLFTAKQSSSLREDLHELIRLLTSIIKTTRNSAKK